jgi:enoyl-CoA hydratase
VHPVAEDILLTGRDNDTLRVIINRPDKRNALSLELLDRIGSAFAEHAADPALKCAVLTASGDRCFAAGGDLRELEAVRSEADTLAMSRRARAALERIRRFPVPVVAVLNGHALGGGAELAMACDLRIATAQTELGFLQAQLNVTTAWGGGIDLLAALGSARALQILLEARRIPAAEALQLGLLQRVCTADQTLGDCTASFIAPFLERPVQVLRAFKALALEQRRTLHEQLAGQEERGFTTTWIHADHWTAAARALAPRL